MTNNVRWITGGAFAIFSGVFLGSCASSSKPHHTVNPESHKQFQALDTNKDGKVSYAEFLKAPMAKKSSNPRALFEKIDTSGDGYITVNEWRDYRLKNKKSS
ncbi:MAG: EF-hand domain-containing protein [Luteolibacter sp.]|uniref:EF-hand domain-containing protein n=1 Tax=Luteolibacter sp. TaxID=1962973 RepID=UPI003267FAD8